MTSRKITYSSDAVNSERSRAGQEKYITSRKPKEMEMRDTHRLVEFVTALYRLAPGPLRFNHEDGQNLYVVREALRELQQCREENERLREEKKSLKKKVRAWERLYEWKIMAQRHGTTAAQVNYGKRPARPSREK